jgi:hypothetical protein
MSRFNLDFRESKPKFLSPNSFSTMAEITPTTSLYLLLRYQRVWEPNAVFKIHNIREYPHQQWLNRDRKKARHRLPPSSSPPFEMNLSFSFSDGDNKTIVSLYFRLMAPSKNSSMRGTQNQFPIRLTVYMHA